MSGHFSRLNTVFILRLKWQICYCHFKNLTYKSIFSRDIFVQQYPYYLTRDCFLSSARMSIVFIHVYHSPILLVAIFMGIIPTVFRRTFCMFFGALPMTVLIWPQTHCTDYIQSPLG